MKRIADHFGRIDVLINNAGQARGLKTVEEGDVTEWRDMVETNVMGLLWVTQATIPIMKTQGSGHIVNLGSVAGHDSYPGGSVYAGTKFAVRAITVALRYELLGTHIRVSSVDPGLVDTEFSLVRFAGDASRAENVYRGIQPLTGTDVAECIVFAASRPDHVNVDEIIVKRTAQASSTTVHRRHRDAPRLRALRPYSRNLGGRLLAGDHYFGGPQMPISAKIGINDDLGANVIGDRRRKGRVGVLLRVVEVVGRRRPYIHRHRRSTLAD